MITWSRDHVVAPVGASDELGREAENVGMEGSSGLKIDDFDIWYYRE